MAEIISDDMFDELLNSIQGQYFFHRDDGPVEIEFEGSICVTNPGEEDLAGRIWEPPVMDADGNPLLERLY